MKIEQHAIGTGYPVFVIAEASANHCQDFKMAVALVEVAKFVGADAIKFQTFDPQTIAFDMPILTGHDAVHDAWLAHMGVTTLHQLYAKGGLPRAWHRELKHIADDLGLVFLSTPFSIDAAKFLVCEIGVSALKIASGDLTFRPLLEYATSTGLPLLVSTGMATMEEVWAATIVPLYQAWLREKLCLLHCTSSYPLLETQANLSAIVMMHDRMKCPIGYSDHTVSIDLIPALAVSQGACVYEKHLRLDAAEGSPDAGHSLTPGQFVRMVEVIRSVPQWLGDGIKTPQANEAHELLWTRRSPNDWLRPTEAARAGRWS